MKGDDVNAKQGQTSAAPADERSAYDEKVRGFARSVARRHRGRPADAARLLVALRGYHQAWALFAAIPPLDENTIRIAVAAYAAARPGARRVA
jgi:hypothetical protein